MLHKLDLAQSMGDSTQSEVWRVARRGTLVIVGSAKTGQGKEAPPLLDSGESDREGSHPSTSHQTPLRARRQENGLSHSPLAESPRKALGVVVPDALATAQACPDLTGPDPGLRTRSRSPATGWTNVLRAGARLFSSDFLSRGRPVLAKRAARGVGFLDSGPSLTQSGAADTNEASSRARVDPRACWSSKY